MKVDRTRYIGCSVVLASSTKGIPYREKAERLVKDKFRTHTSVLQQVSVFHARRKVIYRKILIDLWSKDSIRKMIGKMPIDFKTCFTAGGSADYPLDNAAAEQLYDCVLDILGIRQTDEFTSTTAERFRLEAAKAIRYNKMNLGLALVQLEKEGRLFDLDDHAKGDKLYHKIRKATPDGNILKDEIKAMAYAIVHASSAGIDAVYITGEDIFDDSSLMSKIGKAQKEVLKLSPQDCLEIAHLSKTWF